MRKVLLSLVAIAAAVFATSCTNDLLDEGVKGGNRVTFNISTPELATRAFGDGATATDLYYAVYEGNTLLEEISVLPDGENPVKLQGGKTSIMLDLASGIEYNLIFWAAAPDAIGTLYNVNFAEKSMSLIDPDKFVSQNENLDAFYAYVEEVEAGTDEYVELYRPFAQLNISVSDADILAAQKANLNVGKTQVSVEGAYTKLNLTDGTVSEPADYNFALAAAPKVANTPKAGYTLYSMNYLLVDNTKTLVDVKFGYTRAEDSTDAIVNEREFGNVPVQRNYRTNIYGDLLTKSTGFEVEIMEDWLTNVNHDYNIVFTGYELVRAILAGNQVLLGNNITITAADIEAALNAPAPVMSRASVLEGRDAIINLGGYTLTFANGAELDLNGGSVTLDGEGKIVANDNAGFDGDLYIADNSDIDTDSYKNEITTSVDGLRAAFENGGEYTVGISLELDEPLALANGKELVLTFKNNAVLSIIDTTEKNFELIRNQGNLTIDGEGKLTVKATVNSGWNRYSAVIANTVGGNLTVKGVEIEHLGGTDMAYGIDNLTNGKGTVAVTTIDGATVKSPYRAVRQFLNGIEATNELYVKAGSVIEGANKSVWMQDPSKNANTGKLVVEAGAQLKGNAYLSVTAGSTEWPIEVSLAKSALVGESELLTSNIPTGYQVVEKDGNYIVVNGNEEGTYFVSEVEDLKEAVKVEGATVYVAEGYYDIESKLSLAKGVSMIGVGEVKLNNSWSSNLFADQAHFTDTYVENIIFDNNLIIDAGIANGNVVFKKCTFGNNRAHQSVHFDHGNGTITFDDCTLVGRNMLGASLEKVTFNNCFFENKRASLTGADKWTGVNMWGKYEFNNCVFDTEAHCNVKCNEPGKCEDVIVATFNNCTMKGGRTYADLLRLSTLSTFDHKYTITIDGTVINENSIFISNADELIATTTINAGQSVILTADIDLAGKAFGGLSTFHPENNNTFDGLGHTVSNWTNEEGKSDFGFICGWVGPIKNLNIDNAHLKTAGRSAIVAAKVYGDIINCHVTNSTLEDGYWASGLIAGLYNAGSIKNCSATNSSIKSNGGTGGIVGVINETSGTRGCYNCSIEGVTVNNTGIYGKTYSAAGICGMIYVDNSTIEFKGCSIKDFTKVGEFVADIYYSENGNTVVVE